MNHVRVFARFSRTENGVNTTSARTTVAFQTPESQGRTGDEEENVEPEKGQHMSSRAIAGDSNHDGA